MREEQPTPDPSSDKTELAVPSYDLIAAFYDEDIGRNNPGRDIPFYVARASAGGPVLELACGTGRITLPLVQHGSRVDALDASLPMLRKLRRKAASQLTDEERVRLRVHWMDMRELNLEKKFALILCPYSAFTYLVEDKDQARALRGIFDHLEHDGLFILDTFVPHYEDLVLPDEHIYRDYRRELNSGCVLEREKTIKKDLTRQINVVRRTYRFIWPDGTLRKTVFTEEKIRYRFHAEMALLLQHHGFQILEEYGDFEGNDYSYSSSVMVFVSRRRTR